MSLFANVVGFSVFGLMARIGQLGIQRRPLHQNPAGHLVSMLAFGYGGYWAYHWEQRTNILLENKRAEIKAKRAVLQERAEAQEAESLQ